MKTILKRKKGRRFLTRVVEAIANLHWHGRELGEVMKALIREARRGGADVLAPQPNTLKPLTTAGQVINYVGEAEDYEVSRDAKMHFIPFVMLTEHTTYEELVECRKHRIDDGKIYPYLRTTQSSSGVTRYGKMIQVVRWCGELGIKVHGHFEHPDPIYIDREAEYLCLPIVQVFLQETNATIIWEHASDARCIPVWKEFTKKYPGRFYITITAHHLAWNEDEASGDVRKRCRPLIKPEPDRVALVRLVSENHLWVMAGADDAAHPDGKKHVHEGKCACGDFTTPFLHALYAHALSHLLQTKKGARVYINFTSRNGRRLHKLPPSSRKITLVQKPFKIPPSYAIGPWTVEPCGAGETIDWQIVEK